MKRFFLAVNYSPYDQSIGITKKIGSEIKTLRKMGYEVCYSAYTNSGVAIYDNADQIVLKKDYRIPKISVKFRRFFLFALCNQYLKQNTFEYGLLRWDAFDRLYLGVLEKLKKGGAVVLMESLAYMPKVSFAKTMAGKYLSYYTEKNAKLAARCIDLVLAEGNLDTVWGVHAMEFGMGVETEQIQPHAYEGKADEYHIISVANEARYHAYDRLLNSLIKYYQNDGKKRIFIHLVGVMFETTAALAHNPCICDKVFLYGKKAGAELDRIYSKCNIAAGPLGQHRSGGKKDTGLKTKEYFARGIPYFYSGREDDTLKDFPFILEVSNDESYIDFDEITRFYDGIKEMDVVTPMRQYALEHYSWDKKFEDVFAELKNVVDGSAG